MNTKSNDKERRLAKNPSTPFADLWLAENRPALESSNAYVKAHGLPLANIQVSTIARFEHVAVNAC